MEEDEEEEEEEEEEEPPKKKPATKRNAAAKKPAKSTNGKAKGEKHQTKAAAASGFPHHAPDSLYPALPRASKGPSLSHHRHLGCAQVVVAPLNPI